MNLSKRARFREELEGLRGGYVPEDYSERLFIQEHKLAIASDVHLPYHDTALLSDLLTRAQEQKIEAIVWLGDLLDMPLFNHYGVTDKRTVFTDQLREVGGLIRLASRVVGKQYWSQGNHEARWMRKIDYSAGMEELALMAGLGELMDDGRLVVSDNPTLDTYEWMLTHPAAYGPQPLVVPGKLATRYQTNVLSAHAHHWGTGVDETGEWQVVETGGLFDPRLHQYIQHRVTAHRAWQQGYWFLIHGIPVGYRAARTGIKALELTEVA